MQFRRQCGGRLTWLDDPKYYTRPFRFKTTLNLIPDTDVLEYVCNENEKDRVHYRK